MACNRLASRPTYRVGPKKAGYLKTRQGKQKYCIQDFGMEDMTSPFKDFCECLMEQCNFD